MAMENTKDVAEYLHVDKYYYSIKPEGKAEIVKEEQQIWAIHNIFLNREAESKFLQLQV